MHFSQHCCLDLLKLRGARVSGCYSNGQELLQLLGLLAQQLKLLIHLDQSVVRTLVINHVPGTLNHSSARVHTWVAQAATSMSLLEALPI